jgi:hypothetical protein
MLAYCVGEITDSGIKVSHWKVWFDLTARSFCHRGHPVYLEVEALISPPLHPPTPPLPQAGDGATKFVNCLFIL